MVMYGETFTIATRYNTAAFNFVVLVLLDHSGVQMVVFFCVVPVSFFELSSLIHDGEDRDNVV